MLEKKIIGNNTGQDITYFIQPALNLPGFFHAFVTRQSGFSEGSYNSLNFSYNTGDLKDSVDKNRAFMMDLFSLPKPILFLSQQHSNELVIIDENYFFKENNSNWLEIGKADGFIVRRSNLAVAILTADCLPIILLDIDKKVFALVHAGWRGTASGIVLKAVKLLSEKFQLKPEYLRVGFGPHIRPCCYEVSQEMLQLNAAAKNEVCYYNQKGKLVLDLAKWNKTQLLQSGVIKDNIEECDLCTCCEKDLFFSYRRDGRFSGRQITIAAFI